MNEFQTQRGCAQNPPGEPPADLYCLRSNYQTYGNLVKKLIQFLVYFEGILADFPVFIEVILAALYLLVKSVSGIVDAVLSEFHFIRKL